MSDEPLEILLVDDNDDDIVLVREALADDQRLSVLHTVHDGEEALLYLRRQGSYAQARRPGLVLLDINMPKKNGLEVLQELKRDAQLRHIPIIMLTTSKREEDIFAAYSHGACSFISKPVGFDNMRETLLHFAAYWSGVARLPNPQQ